jgi:anthranilate synthase component 2
MAFEHIEYPVAGIQFHPESVMTPLGDAILSNWINTKFG